MKSSLEVVSNDQVTAWRCTGRCRPTLCAPKRRIRRSITPASRRAASPTNTLPMPASSSEAAMASDSAPSTTPARATLVNPTASAGV
ncbi:hypothetical protein D9M68_955350 [compost metagenome]